MTRRNYYTLALWLPVFWPIIVMFGEIFLRSFTWHQVSNVSGLILLSGLFGGVQYLFFAVLVNYRLAHRNAADIGRSMWFLPTVFAPICSTGVFVMLMYMNLQASHMQVRENVTPLSNLLSVSANIAIFTLMIGYGYIMLLQLVLFILTHFGFVEEAE